MQQKDEASKEAKDFETFKPRTSVKAQKTNGVTQ